MTANARGKVYTPKDVAALLAKVAMEELIAGNFSGPQLRVIDPACGDGSLLMAFRNELQRQERGWTVELYGVDSDGEAVRKCLQALSESSQVKVHQMNLLEKPPDELPGSLGTKFELVLANPPFIRQEAISPALKSALKARFPHFSSRSDLFVYFFPAMAALLNAGGLLAAITPWSWLDVQYGQPLKSYLLSTFAIRRIICPVSGRWFPQASIRPIIVVLSKKGVTRGIPPAIKFQIAVHTENRGFELHTVNTLSHGEILHGGAASDNIVNRKWSTFFYAQTIVSKLESAISKQGLSVKDVAAVRFGVKTGANEFFYFKPSLYGSTVNALGIPVNGCSSVPVIKSLRHVRTYVVEPSMLTYRCIWLPMNEALLRPEELRYIEWGESMGFHRRPSCRGRRPWYVLQRPPADLVVPMSRGARLGSPLLLTQASVPGPGQEPGQQPVIDARLYAMEATGLAPVLLGALLNSTVTWLLIELRGRPLAGNLPLLDLKIYELESIPLPNPNCTHKRVYDEFELTFRGMLSRPMYDVFREVTLEDRHRLDRLFLEWVGITGTAAQHALVETYDMLCSKVKERLNTRRVNAAPC
ncbi:MAG TPA: N-6 DNA methylase [Firmicutes bacterium]|nr:N-6 DNA methylase [Bacillota bacterium]